MANTETKGDDVEMKDAAPESPKTPEVVPFALDKGTVLSSHDQPDLTLFTAPRNPSKPRSRAPRYRFTRTAADGARIEELDDAQETDDPWRCIPGYLDDAVSERLVPCFIA